MIVQCPSCSKRYRVNDDNIPPSGGKIRCPECSHAFVVYPESDTGGDPGEEKTEVAERPDMEKMLDHMQQGGGAEQTGSAGGDGVETEVMSGSDLPEFDNLFGDGGPPEEEDATVEMDNPFADKSNKEIKAVLDSKKQSNQGSPTVDEDEVETQQLDSDIVDKSLEQIQENQFGGSSPPQDVLEQPADEVAKTEVVPPQDFGDFEFPDQSKQQQSPGKQRASAPSDPTPPPGGDFGGGGGKQRASAPSEPTPPPGGDFGGEGGKQRASAPSEPTPPPGGGFGGQQGDAPAGGNSGTPASDDGFGAGGPDRSTGNFGSTTASQPGGSPQKPHDPGTPQQNRPADSPSHTGSAGGGTFGAQPDSDLTGQQQGAAAGGKAPPSAPSSAPESSAAGAGTGGGASEPDVNHDGPWKLQTNFGLTYEFADNDSLRDWLESRDDLDGYELSADGEAFYPIDEFPQITGEGSPATSGGNAQISSTGANPTAPPVPGQSSDDGGPLGGGAGAQGGSGPAPTPSSSGQMPSSGPPSSTPSSPGSSGGVPPAGGDGGGHSPFRTASSSAVGGPGQPPSAGMETSAPQKERINPDEKFEPPSESNTLLNAVLWGVFVLLAAAALLLALELFDVVDLLDDPEEPEMPVVEQTVEQHEDDVDSDEAQVDELLVEADEHREANRLADALDSLDEALSIQPERAELYEQQAEIYEELGQEEQAEQARQEAQQLLEDDEPSIPDLLETARDHLGDEESAEAMEVLEEAVAADPDHVRVHELKAEVHEELGEEEEAEQSRNRARELREEEAEDGAEDP